MYTTYNMVKLYHTEIQHIQYINTLINIEYVHYIQHGEVIPYRNTTIQYINTLINIKYVHYIQHGEVIHTEIQLYNT